MNQVAVPTAIQRVALQQAASRLADAPWLGPRSAAERCCALGWLRAGVLHGADARQPDSVIYELTAEGRALIEP